MRGLLSPPQKGSVVSYLTFLSAMSTQLITSCTQLSVLLKRSLRRRQTFPPGRSLRIAVPLLHANVPLGKEPSLSVLCGQIEEPPRLGSLSVPSPASRPRQKRRVLSELNSSFKEHSLPFVSYLNLIPMDNNFVLWIYLAKHTIQGLLVLDWLTELWNSEIILLITVEEPGSEKSNDQPRSSG